MTWIVVETDSQGVHVLPGEGDIIACGHEAVIDCPVCRPVNRKLGPLDEPVWSHQEPTWPGATEGRLA